MKNIKGKIIVALVLVVLFVAGFFIRYQTGDNVDSTSIYGIPDECIIHKNKESFEPLVLNYNFYKDFFLSNESIAEYEKEYVALNAFANKNCSLIDKVNDLYTYNLCDIYVTGDYSRLDNFKFLEGENKEQTQELFESIKNANYNTSNEKQNILIYSIVNFNNNKTNVDFKLTEPVLNNRGDVFVFLKENGKEIYKAKLDEQMIKECKNFK